MINIFRDNQVKNLFIIEHSGYMKFIKLLI